MGVCRKGERLGLMSMYDCDGKRTGEGGPNVRILLMQDLKGKTPRRRRAGIRGRKECRLESAGREKN